MHDFTHSLSDYSHRRLPVQTAVKILRCKTSAKHVLTLPSWLLSPHSIDATWSNGFICLDGINQNLYNILELGRSIDASALALLRASLAKKQTTRCVPPGGRGCPRHGHKSSQPHKDDHRTASLGLPID